MSELSLNEIGLRTGTDKSSRHHDYLKFYESFLAPLREEAVSILEIGVHQGQSLKMWEDYFTNGRIVGMDIDPSTTRFNTDRCCVEIADQSDVKDLVRVAAAHGPFDLVIDDGSHLWDHQIISLQYLLPFVKSNRFYIMEDIDTSYGRYGPSFRNGAPESAARYLQRLSDYMIGDEVIDMSTEPDLFLRSYARRIEVMSFSRRTCAIKLRG